MRVHLSALAICLALTGAALAEDWQRYDSPAGFSISVPSGRFSVESETAGRLSLREEGGTAQIDVFGVTNAESLGVRQFRDMMEAADPSRRITYRAAGNSWFVLSGYLEDEPVPTVFYAKFMLNRAGTALSAFEISYPASRKSVFDRLVETMEDSLTSPR
jgi:hypothetical protein